MSACHATVRTMLEEYYRILEPIYSGNEIRQLFYLMAEEYLGWQKTRIHLEYEHPLEDEICKLFKQALHRLESNEPVEYITGKCLFNGNTYAVNPGVLIPRPETEEFCQMIVRNQSADRYRELSVLDIGTGSGCIAIDLALRLPFARITGIDRSVKAVETARINASRLGATAQFFECDILQSENLSELGRFDLVVSNPPYVTLGERKSMKSNVLDYEPAEAIFVPDEDPFLFYRSIASFAERHLNRPGWIWLEINERFGRNIAGILKEHGFEKIEILQDIFGRERFATALMKSGIEDLSYWYGDKS